MTGLSQKHFFYCKVEVMKIKRNAKCFFSLSPSFLLLLLFNLFFFSSFVLCVAHWGQISALLLTGFYYNGTNY